MLNASPDHDPRDTAQMKVERRRIRAKELAWNASFEARDVVAFASHYDADGLQLMPVHPPARGRAAIQELFEDTTRDGHYQREVVCHGLELSVSCDLAVSYGVTQVSGWNHPAVDGRIRHTSGFVTVYRKTDTGEWTAIVDTATPERMEREPADDEGRAAPIGNRLSGDNEPFIFKPARTYSWDSETSSPGIDEEKRLIRILHEKADADIATADVDGFARFYAEDGLLMTAGQPVARGRKGISSHMTRLFSLKDFGLPVRYHGTFVSEARDLAFTYGEIALTVGGRSFPGDFVIVYRKPNGGQWRGILDITCPSKMRDNLIGRAEVGL
ncbi:hypothetical protein AB0E04_48150 [Streptomyces sp. NPDC048251]|uniref:YybH family protein n=1 Tax=Streptomyces sp. NPDC048251 TaxID=3154501 RepID=UPI00341227B7